VKARLLTLLIFIPTFVIGQDWAPIGAKWIYDHDSGLPPYLTIIESVKDTVILNKACRKLVTKEIDELMKQNGTYYWDTTFISNDFIYHSNDTVYHYNKYDKSFYPLYLLNTKAHDTILIREKTVSCTKNDYFCSRFEYIVDSISSISLQGHPLKLIYNSETQSSGWVFNRSWKLEKYPIAEKIGSLKYFFGITRNSVMEGEISSLRCYNDNQISYKSDTWTKECEYLRPLNGPSSVHKNIVNDIIVLPNPFDSYIKIINNLPIEYELYDSSGRLLMKGQERAVNTTLLQEGIYFLRLIVDKKVAKTIKLVKHLP
jgi:hypothetical protein